MFIIRNKQEVGQGYKTSRLGPARGCLAAKFGDLNPHGGRAELTYASCVNPTGVRRRTIDPNHPGQIN